eukprot:7391247-Prymnesium_polylepis.1
MRLRTSARRGKLYLKITISHDNERARHAQKMAILPKRRVRVRQQSMLLWIRTWIRIVMQPRTFSQSGVEYCDARAHATP